MKKREVNPNVDASNGYQNDQRMHFSSSTSASPS